MKYIRLFEDFKENNEEGSIVTVDDIIECIKNDGVVYATIIKNLPDNDPEEPLRPLSVDDDGLVTIEYDNSEYEVELKDVKRIEF